MINTHYNTNNVGSYATSTNYKITKTTNNLTGKGTTHKIRQILNFTDEKRWKQFSSRRLELIDKFGLSERKASEQDDNIKQIANMLREEFEYPMDSINEFEKLVTAAVQSVRRNRKRSKKKFENFVSNSNSHSHSHATSTSTSTSSSNSSICSPIEHKQELFTTTISTSNNNNINTSDSGNISISSADFPSINNNDKVIYSNQLSSSTNTTNTTNHGNTGLKSPLLSPPPSVQGKTDGSRIISLPVTNYRSSPSCSISNSVSSPLSLKRLQSNTSLSTVENQYMLTIRSLCFELLNTNFDSLVKHRSNSNNIHVPNFLLDKLINKIQNSKTFMDFTNQNQNTGFQSDKWQNLKVLGEMCTKASISFVIERYFIDQNTISQDDKFSMDFLRQLSSTLFNEVFKHHNIDMFTQIKFLYLIIGTIVKDYGFDSILYPLNEIIHHLIQNRLNVDSSVSTKAQPLLPPLNNGLNILSVVSSQVSSSSHLSPEYTYRETLPSVSTFVQNSHNNLPSPTPSSNKSTSKTTTATTINSANLETVLHTSSHGPLPQLIVKESFANGTLPQPIKQIL
ncbi:Vhr2p PWA37_005361 [Arxiozyma heterogenica]|uniref:Transcription factor VHR1 n=1 Tax=Arxiozyma heterogenica TaxID=278026 RepID=A0AAN8A896_9SACH|nr:hypothetical protein RI543_000293 [Kazachstania heterogenica]